MPLGLGHPRWGHGPFEYSETFLLFTSRQVEDEQSKLDNSTALNLKERQEKDCDQRLLYTMQLSTDFTQRGAYLQIFFYSKTLFSEKLLQRDRFTQTQSSFYAQHFLRRDPFTNRLTSFYHTALRYFTHTHKEAFAQQRPLHT